MTTTPDPKPITTSNPRPDVRRFQPVIVDFSKAPHFQLKDPSGTYEVEIEDYWDKLTGKSWMNSAGNPAAIIYAMRSGLGSLPIDDNVLYVKLGGIGVLVHTSEVTFQ
jgi:hypothetical protein